VVRVGKKIADWDWANGRGARGAAAKFGRLLTLQDAVRSVGPELARHAWVYRVDSVAAGGQASHVRLTHPIGRRARAEFLEKRGNGVGLRLGVKKTGCSGFGLTS